MDNLETTGAVEDRAPADELQPKERDRVDEIVADWFERCIRNSPVARNVDAFNHMQTAVEDLVASLKKG